MATKSKRSSSTQFNARGVTQGNTLVDPNSGLPLDVIADLNGIRRLAVDAAITLANPTIDVKLEASNDSVRLEDPTTGAHVKVNTDGSIDANVAVSAASGDNIALSDGTGLITTTVSGGKRALDVSILSSLSGEFKQVPAGVTATVYGSQSVTSSEVKTVVSYTVPTGNAVYAQKLYVSGDSVGKFTVYKNSSIILIVRLSQTTFYQAIDLATNTAFGLSTVPGDIIRIDVQNVNANTGTFDATIQTMNT